MRTESPKSRVGKRNVGSSFTGSPGEGFLFLLAPERSRSDFL